MEIEQHANSGNAPRRERPTPDAPVIVARFWKSARDRKNSIVISIKQWEGHTFLDCRVFGTNTDGQSVPTSKGLTVGMVRLPEFAAAVSTAVKTAREMGLLPDGETSE